MGRLRMTGKARARLGVLLGAATASVGVGMAVSLDVALMVGGVLFGAWCLFLADVDSAEGGKVGRS